MTRDVGVQSTPTDLTSSSATPPSSPQTERLTNKLNSEAGGNSPSSTPKVIFMEEEVFTAEFYNLLLLFEFLVNSHYIL